MLIDPSNPGIVHGGPTEIPDVTGTNLELHGDHGYSLVTEAGKHVQRIRAYDASGNALEVGEINYTTDPDSAPSLQPFYTGTEVRVLLRYDNRILYTRGTCGDF